MASGISLDKECIAAFDQVLDVKWSRNPLAPANLLQGRLAVRNAVAKGKYDLVHVHTPVAGLVCRLALRGMRTPVCIYTAHGFHFHENGSALKNVAFLALEKLAGRWTDYLVVINREDEKAALRHRLLSSKALVYMPGIGLDTSSKYNRASVDPGDVARFRDSIGVTPDCRLILMVAEFIPRKRHQDALAALPLLAKPNVHLVFAGTGPLIEPMKQLSRNFGVDQRVHFLGLRSDVAVLMRAADALLLCSAQEGLPRSIMEALSLEVPVIASDIRGNRELLADDIGHLYPVGNVSMLVCALAGLLSNPQEAARRAKLGREKIEAYDIRHILSMHDQLYAAALFSAGVTSHACAEQFG